jgi:hypothetical protein
MACQVKSVKYLFDHAFHVKLKSRQKTRAVNRRKHPSYKVTFLEVPSAEAMYMAALNKPAGLLLTNSYVQDEK